MRYDIAAGEKPRVYTWRSQICSKRTTATTCLAELKGIHHKHPSGLFELSQVSMKLGSPAGNRTISTKSSGPHGYLASQALLVETTCASTEKILKTLQRADIILLDRGSFCCVTGRLTFNFTKRGACTQWLMRQRIRAGGLACPCALNHQNRFRLAKENNYQPLGTVRRPI